MATTKVTLSMDSVALSLAQRAAELSGSSVSAVVSAVLNRHLLTDYAPTPLSPNPDRDHREAEAAATDLELEAAAARWDDRGYGHRAAG
ncbi:hypothetical protein [Nocardia huaxiensis]|uniref:hypothetical protein n=1 Tax=Nocardia huaxiensis TaxID=2755382 RepID=UPI001E3B8558|nr:hypothetical protein [Nocardia huaxiensis]UFS95504.1 hypothetical protein LPY97_33320 [Nocardia huaxiensis]